MGQAFSSVYCDLRFNGSASDHLHALKLLVWEANVHHVYAPYTLARASIEASSTAVWLLSTKTRGERVLRALRWYAQDCHDSCRFMDDEMMSSIVTTYCGALRGLSLREISTRALLGNGTVQPMLSMRLISWFPEL